MIILQIYVTNLKILLKKKDKIINIYNLINQKAIKRLAKYKGESYNVGSAIKVNGKYKQLEECKKYKRKTREYCE